MKNTDKTEQQSLLDKFYEGNTSLQEEKLLSTDKQQSGAEKDLFRFFESEKKVAPPSFPTGKLEGRHFFLSIPKIAASIAFMLCVGLLLYNFLNDTTTAVEWVEVKTELEGRQVALPDGSRIALNKNSLVKYESSFSERLVYLEGEAFFEVQKDEQRPFKVVTGRATTEVLGTAFNLKWMPGAAKAELEVSEGKVAFSSFVQDLSERIFVVAGERAIYDEASNTIRRFESFDPNLIAWKTKQLSFEDASLKKLLEDAAAYFGVTFSYGDDAISNCRFSGTFDDPTLEELLNALKYVLDINYEKTNDKIVLTGRGC
jgi:transmembrane sensor